MATPEKKSNPRGASKPAEVRLRARAVARGVAVGRVVCLHGRRRQYYRIDLEDAQLDREIRRFRAAVRLARRQLNKLAAVRAGHSGDSPANIFEAHRLILEDRSLHDKIEKTVIHQKVNAEWAVKVVTDGYIATYKAFADEHLREKYIDLEDVADRLLAALGGGGTANLKLRKNSIIVAREVKPSTLLELTASEPKAIITEHGGWTSHTFILARELNLPAVTGMKGILRRVQTGDEVVVDGFSGQVILHPTRDTGDKYRQAAAEFEALAAPDEEPGREPLKTLDGVEIVLRANFDLPQGFSRARKYGAKGIGLYRSEFLFNQFKGFPNENEQIEAYRRVAELAGEDGVRIRTFDLSLDQLADETEEKEKNPALGLRAVRLMLDQKKEFRTQLRAILQAAYERRIDIVVPMVSDVAELRAVRKLIADERKRLATRGIPAGEPRLGAMIEVPSAVFVADELAREADFFCLGTNDLVQYLLAVDRDNESVADSFRTLHPAVLRALRQVLDVARRRRIPAVVCGEMAGSPVYVPILLGLGATELSMNVHSIARVRRTLSHIAYEEAREIVGRLTELATADEIEEAVRSNFLEKWAHLFSAEILPRRRASARRKKSA